MDARKEYDFRRDIHETAYAELARNRGEQTTITIVRPPAIIDSMMARLTQYPSDLPANVTVILKDNTPDSTRNFTVSGVGEDVYKLAELINSLECSPAHFKYHQDEQADCSKMLTKFLKENTKIFMGIITGNPEKDKVNYEALDANSRFFSIICILRETLKPEQMQKLLEKFYKKHGKQLLNDCADTFNNMLHVLNAFTATPVAPEQVGTIPFISNAFQNQIIADMQKSDELLSRLFTNQLDKAEAVRKFTMYFPDKLDLLNKLQGNVTERVGLK